MVADPDSGKGDNPNALSGVKTEFAARLRAAIDRNGWTATEAARRVSNLLGPKDKFSRAHLWQYLNGKSLPRTRYLRALSRALDVRPEDLIPRTSRVAEKARAEADHGPSASALGETFRSGPSGIVHIRDFGDGTALLQVSERIPWETALAVMRLLKTPEDDSSSSSS